MKKKTVIAAALLLAFAAAAWGQETPGPRTNHLSFGLGGLVALSDGMVSLGPGLQVSWFNPRLFTSALGLGIHFGAFLPIFVGALNEQATLGVAATLLAGPSRTFFDNGRFRIPVTLGIHVDYVVDVEYLKSWVWNIGAGAAADIIWQFGRKWYAYGRVQAACNFGKFEFLVTPGLGVGYSR